MGVEVGIRNAIHGPRREVRELAPGHVAGRAFLVLSVHPDAGFHFPFNIPHRLIDGGLEGIEDAIITRQAVENGYALGDMEIEIVADGAFLITPGGKRQARRRVAVIAQGVPRRLVDTTGQPKTLGTLPAPLAE